MKKSKEIDDIAGYISFSGKIRWTKTEKEIEEMIAAKEKLRADKTKKRKNK
jgi:hypothetical protein